MEGIHTNTNKFPPELIDSIVGELDHEEANHTAQIQEVGPNRNLLPCMKVSRSFYLAARRRIFANVFLYVFNGHKTTDRLANPLRGIITANPAVLNEVKSLTVNIVTGDPEYENDLANTPIEKEHPTFTGLLLLLARGHIRSYTLQTKFLPWGKRTMCADLSALNDSMLLALIAIRCAPSLRALRLRDLGNLPEKLVVGQPDQDPLETLGMYEASFPSQGGFRSLCLPLHPQNRCSFASMDSILGSAPTVTSTPLSKLVNLELSCTSPFYKYIQKIPKHQPPSLFTLTNLKSFRYSPIRLGFDHTIWGQDNSESDDDAKDAFYRLVLHHFPVLESLTFQLTAITNGIPLNLIPTLRNLHINLHVFNYQGPRQTELLEYLSQTLDKATTTNSIEIISIHVTFSTATYILADLVDPRSHWRLVDETLGRPAYASLKKVKIMLTFRLLPTLDFSSNDRETKERVVNARRDSKRVLPALMNRGGVELVICVAFGVQGMVLTDSMVSLFAEQ